MLHRPMSRHRPPCREHLFLNRHAISLSWAKPPCRWPCCEQLFPNFCVAHSFAPPAIPGDPPPPKKRFEGSGFLFCSPVSLPVSVPEECTEGRIGTCACAHFTCCCLHP